MTFQVKKSLLTSTGLFDIEVAAYAKEVRDWLAQEARVREEEERDDIAPANRHHRYPPPTSHPLIMNSVDETGKPDYEFVDDPIEERKQKLVHDVQVAAQEAITANVMSPAKMQAANLRMADIAEADKPRISKATEKHLGLLQKMKLKSLDEEAVKADVAAMRSEEDNRFLADMEAKKGELARIHRIAVQACADIEDLTLETIGEYQLPKF